MRTSRIARDTSKVLSAIASRSRPTTRQAGTRSQRVPLKDTPTVNGVVKAEPDSDSELSSLTSDLEDTVAHPATSPLRSRKRKRGAETPATSVTTLTETATVIPPSTTTNPSSEIADVPITKHGKPKKARKQPAKKKTTTGGDVVVEPPPNWERMYLLTREMRSKIPAPVDNMGCENVADLTRDPRDKRFQTLIALMLSSQTKDTVTAPTIWNMQKNMPGGFNLESMIALPAAELNTFIGKVGFHNVKTKNIKAAAEILRDKFDSDIPDTIEGLMSLPGVGPKMAYLCMSAAWGRDEGIGVDVHVHRITNLWGWHQTKDPEGTRAALESWLPREKWHDINHLLVGFGQTICLPVGRKCGECTLADNGLCPGAVVAKIKKVKTEETVYGEDATGAVKREVVKEERKIKAEEISEVESRSIADIEDIGKGERQSPPPRASRRTRK